MLKKTLLSIAFIVGMIAMASAQSASTTATATSDKPSTEVKSCSKAEGKSCCSKSTSSAEMKSHCSEGSKASAEATPAAATNERKSKKATASSK